MEQTIDERLCDVLCDPCATPNVNASETKDIMTIVDIKLCLAFQQEDLVHRTSIWSVVHKLRNRGWGGGSSQMITVLLRGGPANEYGVL